MAINQETYEKIMEKLNAAPEEKTVLMLRDIIEILHGDGEGGQRLAAMECLK